MTKRKLTEEYLRKRYVTDRLSTLIISIESGYSAETVRKKLCQFGITRRDHCDAQSNFLTKVLSNEVPGQHPTKGRARTKSVRKKISETLKRRWESKVGELNNTGIIGDQKGEVKNG